MVKDVYKRPKKAQRGIVIRSQYGKKYINPNVARAQFISRIILIGIGLFVLSCIASAQLPVKYRVKAVSHNSDTSTSNSATVVKGGTPYIYVPNTFTPNADGLNEKFAIYTHNVKQFEVSIFSSEGGLMANWNTPSGYWDGSNAMVGLYLVMIEWTGNDGQSHEEFSKLMLVR